MVALPIFPSGNPGSGEWLFIIYKQQLMLVYYV
ncbi:hypothetical protein MPLB_1280104 [Mesorhizobium sp. ORS 3324]|nr:hypothetical protein MPLB_1280104 [Mesorhizobium sp. ORS 3324]